MSRAKIASLVLVNWKGVFYERYLLDPHVTALEGANGAGKTTVMIAAYVALLPDMSKLRFTNLGETAATGGDRGIWGRLGELGRPSYTVLDLDVAGTRVVAGVRLLRTAEPTVEPTAFLIDKLPAHAKLSDCLLVRRDDGDHVPELDEIRSAVERAGGEMQTFRAIKDYFAELFERGVTPMRLAADEERSKLNEMLRTSMTGGISRALTSELRSFLLKEESGLGDTLSRMRANLEACARTRSEVADSRRLEREITAIYEAGAEMFAASVHAAREAATEAERDVERARPQVDDAARHEREVATSIGELERRRAIVEAQLAAVRSDLAAAAGERERAQAAAQIAGRLAEIERELAVLAAADASAQTAQATATAARTAARQERTRALEALDRAAHGLADLQAGLDELVRRAHSYRQLARRLDDARRLADRAELVASDAESAIAALDEERARLEAERARLERAGRDLDARRAEHARALAALHAIAKVEPGADSYQAARAALSRLAERESLVARGAELERELAETRRLAMRQSAARALAAELGLASRGTDARPRAERGDQPPLGERDDQRDHQSPLDELDAAECELRSLDDAEDARRTEATAARQRELEVRARLAELDERVARFHQASALAARLRPAGAEPRTRTELATLREKLATDQHAAAEQRAALEKRRAELQQHANAVERSGTSLDPELLRLRDELGAELLASRFEELDVASASWVEAKLGPIVDALIVDDLDAAAAAVEASQRTAATVHLVAAGTALAVDIPEDLRELGDVNDVVSVEPYGLRVTRRRPRPSLGRRARERQVADLHAEIARAGDELDAIAARVAQLTAWRRDVEHLDPVVGALEQGDPSRDRELLASEQAALAETAQSRAADDAAARERTVALRARIDGLRRLLPDAGLLSAADHASRATELATALAERETIRSELAALADARATLADHVDVLRAPPPDDADAATRTARLAEIDARLDRIALARSALDDVLVHRHASADHDAETALGARTQLAPALEAQHAAARDAVQAAADAEAAAEATWETATKSAQQSAAARTAAVAHRDRTVAELAALGPVPDASALRDSDALSARADTLDRESRELVTQLALAKERQERAHRAVADARDKLAAATRDAGPALEAWTSLRDRASADGVLHQVLADHPRTDRSSVQLAADAWSKREVLLDRVARARGGDELAQAIRGHALDGLGYLASWQAVRDWLRLRVPAQVADVDEPLLALERLRDHLDVLEGRLGRQEMDLRGASEDVARGIDVQVRRAHGQVRRLNTQLEGIKFGSIHGIRVEIRRIERMEQILRALRLGEAQELLFVASIPIEEALDEIFRRYGGGGRAGGQRLLDYREYVELAVEIRRQTSGAWEPASPTKLSTGEAIGVGAALMMVVLTEWERDANLLRARKTGGSLRFLFLDEANRLSRDNLGVLFDLCKSLDLQLLIAAPEVARAEGNTTYRLVRHVSDDGREEVIVSGRRAMAVPPPAETEPESDTVAP